MPEYLAPGVYVEEVNTGSKPIEGVSTSTAGMVGVTERGPENVPILVTSYGEYRRLFGGELSLPDYTDFDDRVHAYLPHAVQGFFQNDGRRNYVVRVAPDAAELSDRVLFDRVDPVPVATSLLRMAPQNTGTLINPPLLYLLNPGLLGIGDWIRVGVGSHAEYRQVDNLTAGATHVSLGSPLTASYPAGANIYPVDSTIIPSAYDTTYSAPFNVDAPATATGPAGVAAGSTALNLTAAAADITVLLAAADTIVEIGIAGTAEYIRVASATGGGTDAEITLASPLQGDVADGATVTVIDIAGMVLAVPGTIPTLEIAANSGDTLVFPDDNSTFDPGEWAIIGNTGGTDFEIRRIGNLGGLSLDVGAYDDYRPNTRIQAVQLEDDEQSAGLLGTASVFPVVAVGNLVAGMSIAVDAHPGLVTIQTISGVDITVAPALPAAPAGGESVVPTTELTADVVAGSSVLPLANRVGIEVGVVLRVGTNPDEEYVTVVGISGQRGVAPDAGNVVIGTPLQNAVTDGTWVTHQLAPVADPTVQAAVTVLHTIAGGSDLLVSDDANYAVGDLVRTRTPGGLTAYHRLVAPALTVSPGSAQLNEALEFSHSAGIEVVGRSPMIEIHALDRGAWGNRLEVSIEDLEPSLVRADLAAVNGLSPVISLSNYTNVEAGTVLQFLHPDTGAVIGDAAKVVSVDRSAGEVELAAIVHPDVITAHTGLLEPVRARSSEFQLNVFLLQRPDPAVPSRNRTVIDSESFVVTLDPRNSNYIHKIGTTWTPGDEHDHDGNPLRLWDQRSEGESKYIRVRDLASGNTTELESIRFGPEALVDVLENGREQPAQLPLSGGMDAFDSIINVAQGDNMYLGVDNDEPRLRTGIHALQNVDVSIVAVPGQFTVGVQAALVTHCERDRYRFAVLDAEGPNRDTLANVLNHRQNYDTKYAALYHPWLTIPEMLPPNIANIRQLPIPPSGHMMGVYARTDNTRGVHKAPANEVVRGITGLTRSLNQREHDLLNPFPININVIRNFRENNRGLRVWGARCITSDSDYKYVNVRRLMIYLEASIERGLQWVVFEPNAEPLWARVTRAITNFLTIVWRNGALEGVTVDQAFFVKCDRTTMTQTDIDNGRLICEIGVAPVKPAEFVIVRIGLWTASAD